MSAATRRAAKRESDGIARFRFNLPTFTVTSLSEHLNEPDFPSEPYASLRSLIDAGYDGIPLPGAGNTLKRWQMLATVARHDLTLAKLFESHTDALAILNELKHDAHAIPDGLLAVWSAELPDKRVYMSHLPDSERDVQISGVKAWCSGAAHVRHALVSVRDEANRSCLVQVEMNQPAVNITRDGWHAVGMARTASVDVVFEDAVGSMIGSPGAYVERPGFQHGAAGIAACWYGAASAIAGHVRQTLRRQPEDPHAFAHLGAIDIALTQARGVLLAAAAEIDAFSTDGCAHAVRRARLAVETAAETVLLHASRALGAAPMCKDARFARMMADLPVFIRQSHAERDLAAHGLAVVQRAEEGPWTL
ncbi:acyl-CoA dehydrogenase [Pandoraea sp. NPDC087047]|uniref:acyl-CoA dehydrogenase n=1 Tax=Pandoraea sp. NPDC087047 TaxID=3364390 RepID=UPI00381EF1B5